MQTNKTKIIINTEKYLTTLAKDFTSFAILGFLAFSFGLIIILLMAVILSIF